MVTAKCNRCLGTAEGKTFSEASQNIDHAIGLSRGKKCGRKYNQVVEVGATSKPKKTTTKKSTPKPTKEKSSTPISEDKE